MRKQLVLLCLFVLLLVSSVLGAYRFYEPYYGSYGYGYGTFGTYFDMFLDFIEDNEYLVDAIVFLVIFLIISKRAFKSSFSGEPALYVVIGIALTIGIMMYERRTGYSFIINSGWLSVVVLFALVAYIMTTGGALTGLGMMGLGVLGFVGLSFVSARFPQLYHTVPPFVPVLLIIGFLIMLIYGFLKLITERKSEIENVRDTVKDLFKKK